MPHRIVIEFIERSEMDGINLPISSKEKLIYLSPMTTQIMSQLTTVVSKNKNLSAAAQVSLACKSSYGNMSHPYFNYIQRIEFLLQKNEQRDHYFAMQYLIDCPRVIDDTSEFRVMREHNLDIQNKWREAKNSINGLVNRVRTWGFQKDPTGKVTWGAYVQASLKMDEEEGKTEVIVEFMISTLGQVKGAWNKAYEEFLRTRHMLERTTGHWEALKIEYVKNIDNGVWRQYGDFLSLTVNVKTGKIWRYMKHGQAMWVKEGDLPGWSRSIGWGNKDKTHMTLMWSRNKMDFKLDLSECYNLDYTKLDRELSECMEGSSI